MSNILVQNYPNLLLNKYQAAIQMGHKTLLSNSSRYT